MIGAMYKPTSLSLYNVIYRANGFLINSDTGVVVASGTCEDIPDDPATAGTYDQLMANDSALFLKLLAAEQAACVVKLKKNMLRL